MSSVELLPALNPIQTPSKESPRPPEATQELAPYKSTPPALPSPKQVASEHLLLGTMEELSDLQNSITKMNTLRLQAAKGLAEDLCAEQMKQLKETAENAKTASFWSFLRKIADGFLSALSFIFGASLIASGGSALVGGALIASGLLAISNLTLSECKGWDWISNHLAPDDEETKRKLAHLLPTITGLLASGCGLVGSIYGINSGILPGSGKTIAMVAQTLFSVFKITVDLKTGFASSKLTRSEAALRSTEEKTSQHHTLCELLTDRILTILSSFAITFQQTKKAMQSIIQTQSELTGQSS